MYFQVEDSLQSLLLHPNPYEKSAELEECSNCCEPIIIANDSSHDSPELFRKSVYELRKSKDGEVRTVSSVLERIYKLSHLRSVSGTCEEGLKDNVPLCLPCANALMELDCLFENFARARKFESYISKQIERLDEIIRKSIAPLREVNDQNGNGNDDDFYEEAGDFAQVEVEGEPEETQDAEIDGEAKVIVTEGPWVVLKRLKPEEIPCHKITSQRAKRARNRKGTSGKKTKSGEGNNCNDSTSNVQSSGVEKERKRHGKAPIICKECGREFKKMHYLRAHEATHSSERPFACDECTFTAKLENVIRVHKKLIHGEVELIQCPECPAKSRGRSSHLAHFRRMHTEEGRRKYLEQLPKQQEKAREKRREKREGLPTFCSECRIDFETPFRIMLHNSTVHRMNKKYQCEKCGKSFDKRYVLRNHLESIHLNPDSRPFVCEHCGNSFKDIGALKIHLSRSHTEEGRLKYNEDNRKKYWRKKRKQVASTVSANNCPLADSCEASSEDPLKLSL